MTQIAKQKLKICAQVHLCGACTLILISDEAWFHLSGYTNSHGKRYWLVCRKSHLNPVSLHDINIDVWCSVSVNSIIIPMTLSHQYATHIWQCVLNTSLIIKNLWLLSASQCSRSHCKQFYALPTQCLGDRITSKGMWPPHLPDLNPYYFHVWGLFKDTVHGNDPCTEDDL
jgi:hypothetical protein